MSYKLHSVECFISWRIIRSSSYSPQFIGIKIYLHVIENVLLCVSRRCLFCKWIQTFVNTKQKHSYTKLDYRQIRMSTKNSLTLELTWKGNIHGPSPVISFRSSHFIFLLSISYLFILTLITYSVSLVTSYLASFLLFLSIFDKKKITWT
jgi:hypothetical protein